MTKELGFFKPMKEDLLWEEGQPPTESSRAVVDQMIRLLEKDLEESKDKAPKKKKAKDHLSQ